MAEMTAAQLQKIENQWLKSDCDDLALAVNHIFALLAEVRRLQEKLQYEETCHAEAQEEVRRLTDENKKYKDAWILQQVRAGNFESEVGNNG